MPFSGLQDTSGTGNSILSGVQVGLRARQMQEEEAARQQAIAQRQRDAMVLAEQYRASQPPGAELYSGIDYASPETIQHLIGNQRSDANTQYERNWNEDQRTYTRGRQSQEDTANTSLGSSLYTGQFDDGTGPLPSNFGSASPGIQQDVIRRGLGAQDRNREHQAAYDDYASMNGLSPGMMGPPTQDMALAQGIPTATLQRLTHDQWKAKLENNELERERSKHEALVSELDGAVKSGKLKDSVAQELKLSSLARIGGLPASAAASVMNHAQQTATPELYTRLRSHDPLTRDAARAEYQNTFHQHAPEFESHTPDQGMKTVTATIDIAGPDGKPMKLTLPSGAGKPLAMDETEPTAALFMGHAAKLIPPQETHWYGGGESPVDYKVRVLKAAAQLASQFGWKSVPPGSQDGQATPARQGQRAPSATQSPDPQPAAMHPIDAVQRALQMIPNGSDQEVAALARQIQGGQR